MSRSELDRRLNLYMYVCVPGGQSHVGGLVGTQRAPCRQAASAHSSRSSSHSRPPQPALHEHAGGRVSDAHAPWTQAVTSQNASSQWTPA